MVDPWGQNALQRVIYNKKTSKFSAIFLRKMVGFFVKHSLAVHLVPKG